MPTNELGMGTGVSPGVIGEHNDADVLAVHEALAGAPPTMRSDNVSPAVGAIGLRSDLDKGLVKASWVKRYTDADRDRSIVDLVTFELK